MSETIRVMKKNESTLSVDCDMGILYELKDHFTFEVPGARFSPKFKAKVWDGKISLLDLRFGTLPAGLFFDLVSYAKTLGYEVEAEETAYGSPTDITEVTAAEVSAFVESLDLYTKGSKIVARDFQLAALVNCIRYQKQISITPTGGGKSLILYCLYRWYAAKGMKFMLVVPNLSLIKQMYSDFIDYSSHNGYDMLANTHVISEGSDKTTNTSLTLATWQSIYKQPSAWLNDVDIIAADEVHQYKADAIKGIFERATKVKYRIGVTGSLDKSAVNKMVLRGLIGEISQEKTTRALIDEGHLSDLKIKCILLKYNKESKKIIQAADYKTEVDWLCQHEQRNKFIRNLALSLSGNTLVLFNFVDTHGVPLYEAIKKKAVSQEVHLVCGDIEADERERIRKLVQASSSHTVILEFDEYDIRIPIEYEIKLIDCSCKLARDITISDDVDTSELISRVQASTSGEIIWKN